MLTENRIKEELNLAYVISVAATKKFATEITRVDLDSVDVTIRYNGLLAKGSFISSPEIKLQLKATSNAKIIDNAIAYQLSIKNYNDLRLRSTCPRLLVVLLLPKDSDDWLKHSEEELVLKKCCYYLNLNDYPESNNTDYVTVRVPLENVFSPDAIEKLMISTSKMELK